MNTQDKSHSKGDSRNETKMWTTFDSQSSSQWLEMSKEMVKHQIYTAPSMYINQIFWPDLALALIFVSDFGDVHLN